MNLFILSNLSNYLIIYCLIGLVIVLLNCFAHGFVGSKPKMDDYFDILMWPKTLAVILGALTRLAIKKIIK